MYQFLQGLSSIIGMAGFLLAIYLTPPKNEKDIIPKKAKIGYWLKIISNSLVIIIVRYIIGVPSEKPFGQIIVISISSFLISIIIVSWVYKNSHN